ncbi:hypothetical protein ACFY12_17660 [Streptomyces sp. NPDC001339]|uniref:hypothetical protein n=1 Tax=Streptomyces sp. NPDC001339 TaxID=3364563 RepID=UPI00369ACEBC
MLSQQKSSRLHIGWIMPPFVHELPVNAMDDETAADQLYTLATELLPNHPPAYQYRFALGLSAQLEPMAAANVIYAGLCPLEVDGRPSLSTIVISQITHDSEDEAGALRTTRELLERKYPDDDCQTVELTCGPALTREGTSSFVIDAEWSASGHELPVTQSQMQAYIPLPDTSEMLVFELSSQVGEDWGLHAELFTEILNTVDWGTDQEVEDYRAMRQSAPAVVEPAEEVKQELYWHSSRLMDAVALRGSMGGGEVTSLTCSSCWAKGMRSACSARHDWYIGNVASDDLLPALPRVIESFASQGWRPDEEGTGERVHVWAGDEAPERSAGYAFTASVDTGAGTFTAEVTAPCARASATSDSLFG